MIYKIAIGDKKYEVGIGEISGNLAEVTVDGSPFSVTIENFDEIDGGMGGGRAPVFSAPSPSRPAPSRPVSRKSKVKAVPAAPGANAIIAPIPGVILEILVKENDTVTAGDVVATMEAMKMENNIVARVNGTVTSIIARSKDQVNTGDVIMIIE